MCSSSSYLLTHSSRRVPFQTTACYYLASTGKASKQTPMQKNETNYLGKSVGIVFLPNKLIRTLSRQRNRLASAILKYLTHTKGILIGRCIFENISMI